MSARAIMPEFGVELTGIDLRDRSHANIETLSAALDEYGMVLVRDQPLTPAEQAALAKCFPHDPSPPNYTRFLFDDAPEVYRIGNVLEDGKPAASLNQIGIEWHTDGTSRPLPCVMTLLHAVETPSSGGETLFASGIIAFELLDAETQALLPRLRVHYNTGVLQAQIEQANAGTVHAGRSLEESPDVIHPLVRVHPRTRRTALWATPREMRSIEGWTAEDSFAFVNRILEPGTTDPHVYAHAWRPGDMVIWDNRTMLHSTTPYTYAHERRLMHRTGLNGPAPVPPPT